MPRRPRSTDQTDTDQTNPDTDQTDIQTNTEQEPNMTDVQTNTDQTDTDQTPAPATEPAVDKSAVFNDAIQAAFAYLADNATDTVPDAVGDAVRNAFRALTPTNRQKAIMDMAMNHHTNPGYAPVMAELNKVLNKAEPKSVTTKAEVDPNVALAHEAANVALAIKLLESHLGGIERTPDAEKLFDDIMTGAQDYSPDFRSVRKLFGTGTGGGGRKAGTGTVRPASNKLASGRGADHVREALQRVAAGEIEGFAPDAYLTPNQLNGIATTAYPTPTPTSPSPGALVLVFGRLGSGFEYQGNAARFNPDLATDDEQADDGSDADGSTDDEQADDTDTV